MKVATNMDLIKLVLSVTLRKICIYRTLFVWIKKYFTICCRDIKLSARNISIVFFFHKISLHLGKKKLNLFEGGFNFFSPKKNLSRYYLIIWISFVAIYGKEKRQLVRICYTSCNKGDWLKCTFGCTFCLNCK